MTTRQALRAVDAKEAAAEDFASGTEFAPIEIDDRALALTDEDYKDAGSNKTLIKVLSSHFEQELAELDKRKLAAEAMIASATQDLHQINTCREAIDLAVGRLNKA